MADAVGAVALRDDPSVLHEEGTKNRRLDVQGLRAVAVLMVIAFHAGLPLPGGFVGVDVFFVISGFVITGMLHREWLSTGRIRFGRFYARRFQRLTPALALTVSVTMILSALMLSPFGAQQVAAKTAIGAMVLAANFVIAGTTGQYFDAPAETNPLLNTWSLSVEEQFYLVFPALVLIAWLIGRRLRRPLESAILLVAIVAAFSFTLATFGQAVPGLAETEYLFGFYSPFTRAWEFAAGALLALAWSVVTPSRQVATAIALLGFAMLFVSLWAITSSTQVPGPWTLLPVVGTLLLLAAGKHLDNRGSRLLATRPMVRVGDWSYSLYLWHWPLIVFARILWPSSGLALAIAAVASVVPAVASYRWVENPIRALTGLGGRRFAMLVAVTLAVPLTIAGLVGMTGRMGWSPNSLKDAAHDRVEEHAGRVRGCHISQAFDPKAISGCEWNADARGRPIYLVGDSNAEQFSEAAIGAGAMLNRPVWIFTGSSCPLVDGLEVTVAATESEFISDPIPSTAFDHCQPYVEEVIRWLGTAPPGDVFIAALDQYWWDPAFGVRTGPDTVLQDQDGKLQVMEVAMRRTVRALERSGQQVHLVQTIPTYRNPPPIWEPTGCGMVPFALGLCDRTLPLLAMAQVQGPTRSAFDRVAQEAGADVLDLHDEFCTEDSCSTIRQGVSRYRDATHITTRESERLAPRFAEAAE